MIEITESIEALKLNSHDIRFRLKRLKKNEIKWSIIEDRDL